MKLRLTLGPNVFELDDDRVEEVTSTGLLRLIGVWLDAQGIPTPPVGEAVRLELRPYRVADGPEGDFRTMVRLKSTQRVGYALTAFDAHENPATLDGPPLWASSNTNVLQVLPAEDGMTAIARAVGPVGVAQISVKCNVRDGPEVVERVGADDVEVIAGEAVSITLSPGIPEEQP